MNDTLAITLTMALCASALSWVVWVIAVNIRRSRTSKQLTDLHGLA